MELLANVKFEDVSSIKHLGKRRGICAISKRNLVAFSAPRCYKSTKEGPQQKPANTQADDKHTTTSMNCDFGGVADTVVVCHLSSPWDIHLVTPLENEIKHIVWDPSGTKLLLADASGQVILWQMHESIVNKWVYSSLTKGFYGDDIIALKWINSSQQYTVAKDVRDQVAFEKKFPLATVTPGNCLFGGRSVEHWVAVTSSGVVGVGIVQHKTEMVVVKTLLDYYENQRIACTDISLEMDGSIQIITSTGSAKDPIRLHKLTTDISSHGYIVHNTSLAVECSYYSCFFPDKCNNNETITLLQYAQPLSSQSVLVAINKGKETEVQQWIQCEETLELHTAFHQANPIIPERNIYWIRQTSITLNGAVSAAAPSPLITDNVSLYPTGTAFYCDDHIVKLVSRQSLNDMSSYTIPVDKRINVTSLAISPNGCVYAALTNTCELLILTESNLSTEHLSTLLEYSLLTGNAWEDILMCIKLDSGMHDKVLQALEGCIAKQDEGTQNQIANKLSMLKISIAMASEEQSGYVSDYLTALLLSHVKSTFASVLSSSQYDEYEQNAEERFKDIMASMCDEMEVDKIVSHLDPASDFMPEDSLVPSLQPKVQWICDLCITLLSSLPVYSIAIKTGSWLVKDLKSMSTIREMLVLIRLWYNTVPRLRPTLSCSMSYDALAKIFKLLTVHVLSLRKGDPLNDNLLDECSLLPTQIVIPPFDKSFCWSRLPYTIRAKTVHTQKYVFGDEPDCIPCLKLPFGQYLSNARKDIFSHIETNNFSKDGFKQCIRCQAMTVLLKTISDQMGRATNISHYCLCGGLWALASH